MRQAPTCRSPNWRFSGSPRASVFRENLDCDGVSMDELRKKGLEKMNEVYSWEMPNMEGDAYFDLTVDHLFGSIWNRPALSMRDQRMMTLTVVTAVGMQSGRVQVNAALSNGELTEDELKEMSVFLTHYGGSRGFRAERGGRRRRGQAQKAARPVRERTRRPTWSRVDERGESAAKPVRALCFGIMYPKIGAQYRSRPLFHSLMMLGAKASMLWWYR